VRGLKILPWQCRYGDRHLSPAQKLIVLLALRHGSLRAVSEATGFQTRVLERWLAGHTPRYDSTLDAIENAERGMSLAEHDQRVEEYIRLVETRGWVFHPPEDARGQETEDEEGARHAG